MGFSPLAELDIKELVAAEVCLESLASPRETFGGQSDTKTGFYSEYFGLRLPVVIPQLRKIRHLLLSKWQVGEAWEP
jgi:hypothetical protein